MGADSAATEGDTLSVRAGNCKSWRARVGKDELLVGFAGNFGEGLFVRHAFAWPERRRGQSLEAWLVAAVQPALQQQIKERFEERKDVAVEWTLLIAAKPARVFVLSQCGDVQEVTRRFAAIGSGGGTALGCLEALELQGSALVSWERVELALRVAETFHASVRGPMHVEALV